MALADDRSVPSWRRRRLHAGLGDISDVDEPELGVENFVRWSFPFRRAAACGEIRQGSQRAGAVTRRQRWTDHHGRVDRDRLQPRGLRLAPEDLLGSPLGEAVWFVLRRREEVPVLLVEYVVRWLVHVEDRTDGAHDDAAGDRGGASARAQDILSSIHRRGDGRLGILSREVDDGGRVNDHRRPVEGRVVRAVDEEVALEQL
mmetsp:Transcript_35676/g.77619  ORF Transcript_35676/g.77619 Transcript_35676/m.77619 type:complete len:202 (-) Transcript_35676:247-852(-)